MGTYKNIMELLVEEEVARQYKSLATADLPSIDLAEVAACALNQLPSLYASSEQGLEYQLQRGRVKFAPQIKQAIQRSIATVLRNPLRPHSPLKQAPLDSMGEVLQQVRQVLNDDEVHWKTLPDAIEQAIQQAALFADQMNAARQDILTGEVNASSVLRNSVRNPAIDSSVNQSVNQSMNIFQNG